MTTPKMNTSTVVSFAIALCLFISLPGCQKNDNLRPAGVGQLLDSIVAGNSNLHFIYDEQQRVIEERFQVEDTLQERTTYQYNRSSVLPYKKNRYYRNGSTPEYSAEFQYNTNGQKIYDSAYFTRATFSDSYVTASLDYSQPGKIVVLQKMYDSHAGRVILNMRLDTLYVGSSGNIDSLTAYANAAQPATISDMYHWYSTAYNQFDAEPNVLKALSTAACNFYPISAYNWGNPTNGYSQIILDYYNTNYPAVLSQRSFADNSVFQFQTQYNSSNLPVSQNVTNTYNSSSSNIAQYRFVYK